MPERRMWNLGKWNSRHISTIITYFTTFFIHLAIYIDAENNVKCSVCEQSFKNMDEFNAHKCGKSGKSFKCTICSKIFARQTLLRQHMVLHQGSKRFRFKCNYCGRAFRHRSHLRDHERIHTGKLWISFFLITSKTPHLFGSWRVHVIHIMFWTLAVIIVHSIV